MKKALYLMLSFFCIFLFFGINDEFNLNSSVDETKTFNRVIKKEEMTESSNKIALYDLSQNPNDGNMSFSDAKQIRLGNNSGTFDSEMDPDYYYFICYISEKYYLGVSGIRSDINIYASKDSGNLLTSYCGEVNSSGIEFNMESGTTYYFCITPCEFKTGTYSINLNYSSSSISGAEKFTLSFNSFYGYSINTTSSSRQIKYYIDSSMDSKYSNMNKTLRRNFLDAAMLWNKLGKIEFVETSTKNSANIVVSATTTGSGSDNVYATTSFKTKTFNKKSVKSSTIVFYCNSTGFNNGRPDDEAAMMICAHELGHSIGLDHSPYIEKNIMCKNAEDMSREIGLNDIATYNYLWR